MKSIFWIVVIVLLVNSCGKSDSDNQPEPTVFRLKTDSIVRIKPGDDVTIKIKQKIKTDNTHLTAYQIVKQVAGISYHNKTYYKNDNEQVILIAEKQKDTLSSIPCIKLKGDLFILESGLYRPEILESNDVIFYRILNGIRDTIAYIPNSGMRTMEENIKIILSEKDDMTLYAVFRTGYKFKPITGTEWRTLKAQQTN